MEGAGIFVIAWLRVCAHKDTTHVWKEETIVFPQTPTDEQNKVLSLRFSDSCRGPNG